MKKVIFFTLIAGLSCCQVDCPGNLPEEFEGEGFFISQNPLKTSVVFVPACNIDKKHYMASLRKNNLGKGITLSLYNFSYRLSSADSSKRFKLLNPKAEHYPHDGVYILPVRLRYKNLQFDSPKVEYLMDYRIKGKTIHNQYTRASVELDTVVFLPYAP